MERESKDYTNCDRCFWHSNYSIIKGPGGLEVGGQLETIQTTASVRTA